MKIEENLSLLREEKDNFIKKENYDEALAIRDKEKKLIRKLKEVLKTEKKTETAIVDEKDVAAIVSIMTGVPVEELEEGEAKKLLNLEKEMKKKVIGQDQAIEAVASVLRRSRVGLRDSRRPIGSFIFLGSSGVGKTLVAKTLAEVMFADADSLIRLDMSEFSERHTVSRLVGAPPGYVGFEDGGELTEKLKHRPYTIILLDEIEKAHPEVFNILLQVLEEGHLMDGKGRSVNFRNSVIIMTSNVGSHLIKKEGKLGFGSISLTQESFNDQAYKEVADKLTEELKREFKVEFLNRVDSILVFRPLTKEVIKKISKLLIKELKDRLKNLKIKLDVKDEVYTFLVKKGFSQEYGARELRRLITENIENPLSQGILSKKFTENSTIKVRVKDDSLELN
jgi:ATP-dependent Clp protease ATP-binding subunit ClpC